MAMAGHFAAIVRSPMTGILLVCEMTGAFPHMLPPAIVAMVSYVVAEMMGSEPIYESLQKLLPLTKPAASPTDTPQSAVSEIPCS